jgi:hypothetical protein
MVEVLELLTCASESGVILDGKDEVFVVKVLSLEEETVSTTLSRTVAAICTVVALHTLTLETLTLFLLSQTSHILGGALLLTLSKCLVDVSQSEASSKDGHLNLITQCRVVSYTSLELEVRELLHEVVDYIHLIHHESLMVDIVRMGE